MDCAKGFLTEVDVNEFSKTENINKTISGEMAHIVWICPKCEEVNIQFKIRPSPIKETCDKCGTKFLVEYENQIIKSKAITEMLDARVVQE